MREDDRITHPNKEIAWEVEGLQRDPSVLTDNFATLLPHPLFPRGQFFDHTLSFFNYKSERLPDIWNTPFGEIVGGDLLKEFSPKYCTQTPHEFHDEIQRAIEKAGYTPEGVRTLRDEYDHIRVEERQEEAKRLLQERMIPQYLAIYIKLREKGYSKHDLVT